MMYIMILRKKNVKKYGTFLRIKISHVTLGENRSHIERKMQKLGHILQYYEN